MTQQPNPTLNKRRFTVTHQLELCRRLTVGSGWSEIGAKPG